MAREGMQKLIQDLEVLGALHLLPDLAALTTEEAAVLLRLSPTTLERMRRDGSGPPYIQGGKKGARGTNQKVTYLKQDLLEYQKSLKVDSSMSAAVRKGQAWLPYANPTPKRSPQDFTTKRPFYMSGGEMHVFACVLEVTMSEFIENLGQYRIAWLNPIHAAMLDWVDVGAKERYVSQMRRALEEAAELLQFQSGPTLPR
jgi:hypothetical protein